MGLIHLDAGVVIGFLDADDAHHASATEALTTAQHVAELCALHRSLRLPDALVLATAVRRSATELITTDHGWPTARMLGRDLVITLL